MRNFTKSDFIQYMDCPEEVWLKWNKPELMPELNDQDFHNIEQGKIIDTLAQELFKISEYLNLFGIEANQVLFQKRVEIDGLVAIADIIVEFENQRVWLFEAKAATRLKDELADDVTFQKVVFEKAGFNVEKCFLVHVNKDYIASGELDLMTYLTVSEISDLVETKLGFTLSTIPQALTLIQDKEPPKRINLSCSKKLDCPFFLRHYQSFPKYSIFDITRLHISKKEQLLNWGVVDIQDVPKTFELPDKQRLQVDIAQSNEVIIKEEEVKSIINQLEYPLYFLDYESFSYVIPVQDKIHPYQQMVFQYSLHIRDSEESDLRHYEYLLKSKTDPVQNLIKHLSNKIDSNRGTVIVWHKSFEASRHKEMGSMYPEFEKFFKALNNRIFDLEDIFSKQLYNHPEFYGKSSIKKILPVLAPHHDYGKLEISNGLVATLKWHHMTDNRFSKDEAAKTYQDLLEYCKLDTLAMVEIFDVLKNL